METKKNVKGKPILILNWELNKDFTGQSTFTWHDHTVQLEVNSKCGHVKHRHGLYIDFHYNGKDYRYLPLVTKGLGEFPVIEDDNQWLDFRFTATTLEIYERNVKTMGDFMDKLSSKFESIGFVRKENNPNKDDKLHLTVRMVPKSSSDIAPKP